MEPERKHYEDFTNVFITWFDRYEVEGLDGIYVNRSDIFLWAIMKELLVPKIREQQKQINDPTVRLEKLEGRFELLREKKAKGVRYD